MEYQVIVGNVGTVYSGEDTREAEGAYSQYLHMSQNCEGSRCYGENVTLMIDGEPAREHFGTMDAGE